MHVDSLLVALGLEYFYIVLFVNKTKNDFKFSDDSLLNDCSFFFLKKSPFAYILEINV